MDYEDFYETALDLIEEYGNDCTILHPDGTYTTNSKGIKTQNIANILCKAVKTNYTAEDIGNSGNLIQAGDVKLVISSSFEPTESTDHVLYGSDKFTIIRKNKVQPDGVTTIVYILQGRKIANAS
ncbi:MAG: hypothetical protein M0R51_09810 [Clostridia bacterium]|jgi:hypothetical protein|nr:hypothetical protein [Clostridia bacterium]